MASDEYAAAVGEALRRAREKAGLTQTEAAHALGISNTQVSSYEVGRNTPRAKRIAAFASVYGVQPGDVLAALGAPTSTTPQPSLSDLMEEIKGLRVEVEALKRKVG